MSLIDDSVLSDAIVRYIGEDRSLTPQDDMTGAREAHPDEGPELESAIVHTPIRSEKIACEDVAPFDKSLKERLYARLRHEFRDFQSQPCAQSAGDGDF